MVNTFVGFLAGYKVEAEALPHVGRAFTTLEHERAVDGHPEATIRVTVRHRVGGESCPPETDSCLEVVVSDNGSGIKETDRARIFEPFFSTKAIGQGTGLGLSIAYGAVKSHGGAIEVESTPGSGTEMTVHLPFTVPKERQEPPGSEGTRANKAAHA